MLLRVATLVVLFLLASVGTVAADSDRSHVGSFHPFTMDPGNGACPASTHTYFGLNFRNCDPVNLVFEHMDIEEVTQALAQRGCTWFGLGGIQWLHTNNEAWPAWNELQLFLYVVPGEPNCPTSQPLCRYHLRLWSLPYFQGVVGAVHYEGGPFIGSHQLLQSWEFAESRVCNDLRSVSGIECRANALSLTRQAEIQAGITWRSDSVFSGTNNSRASVIRTR